MRHLLEAYCVQLLKISQAVTSWVQAFAFDVSSQQDGESNGVDEDGGGVFSEGDGEESEDTTGLQMECTVHEVLLKNQVSRDAAGRS